MAASLTKVMNGYAMTSILNTNDAEVNMEEPLVELDEIDPTWDRSCSTEFESQDQERKILTQLRLENLNTEERKLLVQTCSDYQDIFYLPGDRLSSADAARHTITVEPGTTHKHQTLQVTRGTESGSRGTSERIVTGRDHRRE